MPTFKHPCPACGKFIARDVARCQFCGAVDPFVPGRCPKCRAPIDDPAWVACAKCGTPLREGVAPMPGAVPATAAPGTVPAAPDTAPPAPAPAAPAAAAAASAPSPVAALPAPAPPVPAPPLATTAPPAHAAAAACSGCGAALAPGASFCTACGTLAG